jgi:hypothetical protein
MALKSLRLKQLEAMMHCKNEEIFVRASGECQAGRRGCFFEKQRLSIHVQCQQVDSRI